MKASLSGRSLPGLFFFYFLAALGIFVGIVYYSVASNAKKQIAALEGNIRARYVESQKLVVGSEVERVALRTQELIDRGLEKTRSDLEERIDVASALLRSRGMPLSRAAAAETLSLLAYKPRGLVYSALAPDGRVVYAPGGLHPELAGFYGELTRTGASFSSYKDAGGQVHFIAGKRDAATGLLLCASISSQVMDRFLKRQMLEVLGRERFGEHGYGYFFVVDEDDAILQHGLDQSLIGRTLTAVSKAADEDLSRIFRQALEGNAAAFVRYQWVPPGAAAAEEKTSYIMLLRPWNWIVGSGFYLSDFDQSIRKESLAAAAAVSASMRAQLFALAVAVFLSILIGAYMVLRALRLERDDARHLSELTRYKLLLDESALVSRTDSNGIITYVNDRFCQATGYARGQVVGKSHNIERHPSTPKELFQDLWSTIQAGKTWHGILKNRRADGTSYYKQATILPICDGEGRTVEYIAAGQDITELVEQRARLERVFHTDPLTGLGSRIKLLEDIERAAEPSVALVDIVDFGRINDAYGERVGDQVLVECGIRLSQAAARSGHSLYRMYADTFALMAEGPDALSFIKSLRAIRDSVIAKPFSVGADSLPLDLRIGVANGDKDVFAYADLALGAARSRNVELYAYGLGEDELSRDLTRSVDALKNIHAALRAGRVYPVFQPIADAAGGGIRKFECLLRAATEDGREMAPGEFIPVSKKTRLYPALTRSIVEQSIRAFAGTDFEFSVNLTLEDLFNPSTIDLLIVGAKDAEILSRMAVEIVETEELVGYDEALEALKRLKAEGVKIAIDDFGTGYSNFNYLLKLDPDYVKIDGSIISRIVDDPRAEGLARSIIGFAKESGIKTVAEYVSSEEIARAATALGVDFLQGYWIGKPRREL